MFLLFLNNYNATPIFKIYIYIYNTYNINPLKSVKICGLVHSIADLNHVGLKIIIL